MRHIFILPLLIAFSIANPIVVHESTPQSKNVIDIRSMSHARETTVIIRVTLEEGPDVGKTSIGSGVVIASRRSKLPGKATVIILTAAHVMAAKGGILVIGPDGKSHTARLVRTDPINDLALLWTRLDLPSAELGSLPEWGARLQVVGNPLGTGTLWASEGLFSGSVATKVEGVITVRSRLSAPTHPGNSGGGVWYNGRVVGIVTNILLNTGTRQLFVNMAYFTPSPIISEFLEGVDVKGMLMVPPKPVETKKASFFLKESPKKVK